MASVFSLDNPEFRSYAFYSAILVAKMLVMSPLTSRERLSRGIFANPEDSSYFVKDGKIKLDEPNVERVRRAHLNDLENIPAFLAIGALYVATRPSPWLATLLFRSFTLARVGHTLVYAVCPVPQPARVAFWTLGYSITLYMAAAVGLHFF